MYPFPEYRWSLGKAASLSLGAKSVIMGILNVTPDSFSDGGVHLSVQAAVAQAEKMHAEGAAIIDIGGESTRPGGVAVSAAEEQSRILPVIEALSSHEGMLISVDTYRASTARLAMKAGAHIINDVWGFQKDPEIASVAAETAAGVCSMHTGRERVKDNDVIRDQKQYLKASLNVLEGAGVKRQAIVLDPGFGFAKSPQENAELLARVDEISDLGYPLLIGTSRKRFLGHYTGRADQQRHVATAATNVVARMKGASIFRVHDVAVNRDALAMADAVLNKGWEE